MNIGRSLTTPISRYQALLIVVLVQVERVPAFLRSSDCNPENTPGNPQDCSSLRLSTKYLYCLLPRSPPASSLHKSPVLGAFPLSVVRCFRSTTRFRFPAPRRVSALIFSCNNASDQDEENSKKENLTPFSAKQSHFFRDSKANITMLRIVYSVLIRHRRQRALGRSADTGVLSQVSAHDCECGKALEAHHDRISIRNGT